MAALALPVVKLLIVDDREENRIALRAMLEDVHYKLVEVNSGEQALRLLVEEEFAVLLIDIVMPGMDGFQLAEIIRSREKTAAVPILFMTAVATDVAFVFKGYRTGAVDYLIKPLDAEIVRAKLAALTDLFRQRKLIEASLREKEVLLREVHHRVKNNLQIITSLLHMQGTSQVEAVRNLLAESEARIRSIALVHENLYRAESFACIDVDTYLNSVMAALQQTYGAYHTTIRVVEHGVHLPIDTATPFGLIVNELVSNALKHAFPDDRAGTITVSLREVPPDGLLLEIRDDGIGVPASVDYKNPQSMGLQLVYSLSSQLGDAFEVDRDGGTTIRIRFPRPPKP